MATLWIILILKLIMISVSCLTPDEIEAEKSGWNVDPKTQYHIQTDEGPERYFRYQTLNGQFRKEKRLEDGTVIGTEGWLDPLGYLRIKDYIADRNGYRILRSKTVFVGKNKPIDDAVAISRRVPAQNGLLAQSRRPPNPFRQATLHELSDNSIDGNTVIKSYDSSNIQQTNTAYPRYYSSTILPPIVRADETYNELTKPLRNYNPSDVYQHQPPRGRIYKNSHAYPQLAEPALEIEPPLNNYRNIFSQPIAITARPKTAVEIYPSDSRRYRTSGRFNNTAKVRTSQRKNHLVDRFDNLPNANVPIYQKFPQYDGNPTLSDGFQYYLKSHYHEEEQKSDRRIGSFGYIDPFGIRRVIYYKSDGENGFIHKKNNRYVGSNATPYDPSPIKSSD